MDCFCHYYNDQSLKTAQQLLDFISTTSENIVYDENLFNQNIEIKDTSTIKFLTTSGTTRYAKKYPLYHYAFWIKSIENLNKNPNLNCVIHVEESFAYHLGFYLGSFQFVKIDDHDDECVYDYTSEVVPNQLDWFIEHCKSLGKYFILYSSPSFFLRYLEYLKSKLPNFHVISTNYEAFFKSHGVYVNDCMIDWYTGLNFYTCKYNKRHFLPIFAIKDGYIRNLINLCAKPRLISDYFSITGEPEDCPCGKRYTPFTFIPHIHTAITRNNQFYYDLDIINHLDTHYHSIQFVQEGDDILVLYRGKMMSQNDKSFLTDWWQAKGFKVAFLRNKYLVTGSTCKLATFFNNTTMRKPIREQIFKL